MPANLQLRNQTRFSTLDSEIPAEDFAHPGCMAGLEDNPDLFRYKSNARIWIDSRDNLSDWHYDNGVVNNLNTQIVGRKERTLVSPQTPLDCYPCCSFAIPNDDQRILKSKVYARFVINPGDMLYLPPLWFHAVRSLEEDNAKLMLVFTRRRAAGASPTLARDGQRYRIHRQLSRHRSAVVRTSYAKLMSLVPGYLKINWHFEQLIETHTTRGRLPGIAWIVSELLMLGQTMVSLPRVAKKLRTLERAPQLGSLPTKPDTAGYRAVMLSDSPDCRHAAVASA